MHKRAASQNRSLLAAPESCNPLRIPLYGHASDLLSQVLASAFSAEIERLRDAGSTAAEAAASTTGMGAEDSGMVIDGASESKTEVRAA